MHSRTQVKGEDKVLFSKAILRFNEDQVFSILKYNVPIPLLGILKINELYT
jgi:hypothetical protein